MVLHLYDMSAARSGLIPQGGLRRLRNSVPAVYPKVSSGEVAAGGSAVELSRDQVAGTVWP